MATAANQLPFSKRHAIFVSRLRKNPTAAENEFCRRLTALGLDYRFQQSFMKPFPRVADFFIPSLNLIVEIDGGCHNAEEDRHRDELFRAVRGIHTIRFTNEQVMAGESELPVRDFVR